MDFWRYQALCRSEAHLGSQLYCLHKKAAYYKLPRQRLEVEEPFTECASHLEVGLWQPSALGHTHLGAMKRCQRLGPPEDAVSP
jgi:hypothetical protein